jgi:uncharacterized delta-60 repeat protein
MAAVKDCGKVLVFCLANLLIVDGRVSNAAGLDATFGRGGKVVTDVSGRYDEARALVIEPDGQLVVVGVSGTGIDRDFAVARYDTSGTLDRTFGTNGTTITDFSRGSDAAWAVVLQLDGRIVVAGESNGDFALARYSAEGALDTSFGIGGKITADFGGDDRASAIALQRDGKIVVAGFAARLDFALARYGTDGTLDPTFGTAGQLTTDFSSDREQAFAVSIQVEGKIIVAGATGVYPSAQFAVARYNVDGSLDADFGTGGRVVIRVGRDSGAHALSMQPDGRIVVGGFVNNGTSNDAALARLNADGSVDISFGVDGRVLTDFGGRNFGNSLSLQADGKFVAAGADDFPPYYDFAIAKYEADGRIDAAFNRDGTILTEFGGNSWINAVAIQSDGKIVAAGYARQSSGADFALVRYDSGQ